MTNINWDEVGKAKHRDVQARQVEDYIKKPLEEIIAPLQRGEIIDPLLSMDVIMVLIFIHIDLMGYLYTGDPSIYNQSRNAVKFIREYLGKIDDRYKEVGGLLYNMLRHGWIHRYTPKTLRLRDGTILGFQFSSDTDRQRHLGQIVDSTIVKGAKHLNVSISLLYNDLLSALDLFAKDIRSKPQLSCVFEKALEKRGETENERDIRRKGYDSDFEFIHRLLTGKSLNSLP